MADWTNVLDSAQDPDAPVTSEWGYAMRDNPIAIAKGALGAPRVMPKSLSNNMVAIGVASAVDFVDTVSLTGMKRISVFADRLTPSGFLRIAFSTDSGVSFGGWTQVGETSTVGVKGWVDLQEMTSFFAFHGSSSAGTNTVPVPAGANAIRFSNSAGTSVVWAIVCSVIAGRSDI